MTNEGTDLDTILNGATDEPAAEAVAVVETPQEQPEVEARPRNPDGTFASKGETASTEEPGASPAPEINEPTLEHPALIGERRRRQEAERRATELEQRLAAFQPAPQPEAKPNGPPDRWEDPEGYDEWLIAQATERAASTAEERFQQRLLDSSEQIARSKYADFDDKIGKFQELAGINPRLVQQMLSAPDPAQFAYDYAAKAAVVESYGTVDVEALKAELRKEIMAEETAKLPRPSIPSSLASERNVGNRSGPAWAGPKSLAEILN